MKKAKRIFSILSLGALMAFTNADHNSKSAFDSEVANCNHGRCIKIKSDGNRCKNCAQQYSSYCWSHR